MKKKSLKLNLLMNIMLTISTIIFPLITFPYISRILLPDGTGKIAFAVSFINYFSLIAQLGIPTYGIRACAAVRDNKVELTRTVHELLMINIVMNIVSYSAMFFVLSNVPRFYDDKLLYVIISSTIFLTSLGMEWLYRALEQYTYITIRSIAFKFIALIAMFLLINDKNDYITYGFLVIFSSSASNILNFINAYKYIGFKPVGNYNLKKHFKPVIIFFAMTCATTIYTNLDNVMLGLLTDDVQVVYYNAAVRIKVLLVAIVTSSGTVILPRSSYYVERKMFDEFRRITEKTLNFVFLISLPFISYCILYAKECILFLAGNMYIGSIHSMEIIMPTLLLIGLSNLLGIQILVPLGKERILLYAEIAGAITDVIVNAILIPRLASTGAAIGTLIAEFVVTFWCYYALRNKVTTIFKKIHYLSIAIACGLGTVASIWIKTLALGNTSTLVISAALFFGIYGFFLLWRKEEIIVEIWNIVFGKSLKLVKDGEDNA